MNKNMLMLTKVKQICVLFKKNLKKTTWRKKIEQEEILAETVRSYKILKRLQGEGCCGECMG